MKKYITADNEWLLWIFGVGLLIHFIPTTRDSVVMLTPFVLFVAFLYILYLMRKELNWKVWIWMIVAYLIGFFVEMIGVQTKQIFGNYEYSYTFGALLFETPLLIGLLWLILVWGACQLAEHIPINRWLTIPISASIVLLYDIILEPVAMNLGYWSWFRDIIPLQNYVAWFILAIVLSGLYQIIHPKTKTKLFRDYYIVLFIFMLVLRVAII